MNIIESILCIINKIYLKLKKRKYFIAAGQWPLPRLTEKYINEKINK